MRVGKFFSLAFVLVFLVAMSSPASAVEVIKREQPAPAPNPITAPIEGAVAFLSTWWLPLLIIALVVIVLIFLWKWLKTQKEKNNIFLYDFNRTKMSCKIQSNPRRIKERPIWLFALVGTIGMCVIMEVIALATDNVASFLLGIWLFVGGIIGSFVLKFLRLLTHYDFIQIAGQHGTYIIGNYLGECFTSDGYKNFLCWNRRKYVFWKNEFIIKVNMNEKMRIELYDPDSKKRTYQEIDLPNDLLIEGRDNIIIKGEGLDTSGYYWYPVLMDKNGNIINTDLIAYARAKDVAITDMLYQQTEDFVKVQREAINLNPHVRYSNKVQGQSVDNTSGSS